MIFAITALMHRFAEILMSEKIENVALMSAAGSGKTHALTKRFLFLYLHDRGFALESLYAITFTNAAAFEMKNRILSYLNVLAQGLAGNEPERDVIEYFGSIFPDIQKRAAHKKDHLLSNFSDVHVSTFHSLFASFLSCIPFAAGIMPDYEIIDEPEEKLILMQAIDRVLDKTLEDKELLSMLTELVEQQERTVKSGIDTLYQNLVPWMPYFEELIGREGQIRNRAEILIKDVTAHLGELVRFVHDHEYAALTRSSGKINSNLEGMLNRIREFIDNPDARRLDPVLNYFLDDGILSKRYVQSFVERLESPAGFLQLAEASVKRLQDYITVLSEREMLVHLKPIIEIHKEFRSEKQKTSALSFDDIEYFTRKALRASPETDYLYFKLGSDIKHLMIDEFQDTSFRQIEILEPIMEEITAVDPEQKSLFYVGDPHQAIFRWREGAPELFEYLKDKYQGRIESGELSVNFRTKEEIIRFVNKILDKNDRAKLGNQGGWLRIEELGEFDKKEEGEEAAIRKTVQIVRELTGECGYMPDDIAILTRTNDFASEVARALSEIRIPCVSRSRASILDAPDAQFVLHLLRFLDNPQDDFSLLHVLLAGPGGLEEEKVRRLRIGKKTLYMALLDHHPDWSITARMRKLLAQVYFSNPYEIIIRILQEFNLKISYPLATLLDAALGYTNENLNSLSAFVQWFEYHGQAIEVKETHARGVQILTVHRAKGLEFEIVLIPETNWDVNQPENAQLLFSYEKESARPDKVHWRKYGKYMGSLIEAEQERLKRDALNLLYVALTRAKSGVHMLGYKTSRTGIGFWLSTIHEKLGDAPPPFDEIPKQEKKPVEEEAEPYHVSLIEQGPMVREERTLYSPTERGVEIIESKRRKGMEFGEVVHYALRQVKWLDDGEAEVLVMGIIDTTKAMYARSAQDEVHMAERLASLLRDTLFDPDLRFLFYRDGRDVVCKNELAIYFEDEKKDVAGQVDRLITGADEVVIVDYKTGTEKPEYMHQMRVYKKGIAKIYPGKRIRSMLVYLERDRGSKIVEI
jgi:ATP-dependent exoDNAse (exonuclease V) beta subunit